MREIAILMRRELKSYFASPIAYVFGSLFLGVQSYLSVDVTLVNGNVAGMQAFFGYLPIVFLFFLPALTMRSWAEERKLGTLELLMTFPVTVAQMIVGKFLAALLFLACIMLLTFGLSVSLALYSDLDWGPVLCAYVASLLMAGAYLSLGMFCSSLTRDQIVALLVAVVMLFGLWLLGHPMTQVKAAGLLPEWLVEMLGGLSPNQYFASIARGVLDTRDFVYYGAFCGFFLYLNAMVLSGRRLKG